MLATLGYSRKSRGRIDPPGWTPQQPPPHVCRPRPLQCLGFPAPEARAAPHCSQSSQSRQGPRQTSSSLRSPQAAANPNNRPHQPVTSWWPCLGLRNVGLLLCAMISAPARWGRSNSKHLVRALFSFCGPAGAAGCMEKAERPVTLSTWEDRGPGIGSASCALLQEAQRDLR